MQHIVKRTPRRDKARVLDFLSQFAPMEFVMGELGSRAPQPECASPVVFLARFRDDIYTFLINMPDALAEVVQPVVFQLLRSMYRVPLKWEVHGATVPWCEAAILNTRDLRLLRKGVVLGLNAIVPGALNFPFLVWGGWMAMGSVCARCRWSTVARAVWSVECRVPHRSRPRPFACTSIELHVAGEGVQRGLQDRAGRAGWNASYPFPVGCYFSVFCWRGAC